MFFQTIRASLLALDVLYDRLRLLEKAWSVAHQDAHLLHLHDAASRLRPLLRPQVLRGVHRSRCPPFVPFVWPSCHGALAPVLNMKISVQKNYVTVYIIVMRNKVRNYANTHAQKLYDLLSQASFIDKTKRHQEWYLSLSNEQFDMLLAVRLYTGPMYRYMVMVPNEEHETIVDDHFVMPELPEDITDFENSIYFILASAMYRNKLFDCTLANKLREYYEDFLNYGSFLNKDENAFRGSVHHYLVNKDRIAGFAWIRKILQTSMSYDQYAEEHEITEKELNRKFFWSAVEIAAENLTKFIRESGNVVGRGQMVVYRGLREEPDEDRLQNSFSSVSIFEKISRRYTSNEFLESFEDDDAFNTCCMMRIVLQPGTPYLDTMVLSRSGGWGFGLGDYEYILPPGLSWEEIDNSPQIQRLFPPEIDETVYYTDEGFDIDPNDFEGDLDAAIENEEMTIDRRTYNTIYFRVSPG